MWIRELFVAVGREEHIARHRVTVSEVQEVVFGRPFRRRSRKGRVTVVGQTFGGRYLTIILESLGERDWALITARNADDVERRAFRAHNSRR